MEIEKTVKISELLHKESDRWLDDQVAQVFSPDLASKVLSIAIPIHDAQDMSVEFLLQAEGKGKKPLCDVL